MLSRLKIGLKIALLTLMVSMVGIGASFYASSAIMSADSSYSSLMANEDAATFYLARANRALNGLGYASYQVIAYDGQQAADAAKAMMKAVSDGREFIAQAAPRLPRYATEIKGLVEKFEEIATKADEVAKIGGTENNNKLALEKMGALDPIIANFNRSIIDLNVAIRKEADQRSATLTQVAGTTSTMLMVVSVLAAIAGMAIALFVSAKGITGPLSLLGQRMQELAEGKLGTPVEGTERRDEVGGMAKAVQVFKDAAIEQRRLEAEALAAREAQAASQNRQTAIDNAKAEDLKVFVHAVEAGFNGLAAGDLTVRMDSTVAPEFEPIRAKFNDTVAQLEDTIGSVVSAVGTMRVGLNQITVAAGDLSQRTEQQAASLEETVAALAEVTRGVNQTAQGAEDARAAASLAQIEAEKGGDVVAQAVTAMAEIEQSSEKIGRIIGVIDEIAFQTNLLALNAGVEAARAGEAGRGFAVVAQEVRGLAQRSAEAAKEIKDLIHTSSTQVASGVAFVSASGRSLEQIVAQVGGVTTMISQMAQGAREQSVALKEVSTAADQMDKVTQQNAAMVEETTAAAQSLSSETEQLAGLVDGFRTASSSSRPAGAARSPARPAAARSASTAFPARPVAQMRTTGTGGAAPKPVAARDEWAEF